MTVKVPAVGEDRMLNILRSQWDDACKLRLFQNDYQPADGSVKGDFTEATFSGYAAQSIDDWSVVSQNAANRAEMVSGEKIFAHNGGGTGNTVYGWYLTDDNDSDEVLLAERFPGGSRVLDDDMDDVRVTVTFQLSEPP